MKRKQKPILENKESPPIPAPTLPPISAGLIMNPGFPSPDMFRLGVYDQGIKHLFDKLKLESIARLSPDMAKIMLRLQMTADFYNCPELDILAQRFMKVGLSINGKSREEILRMVEGMTKGKKNILEKARDQLMGKKEEE